MKGYISSAYCTREIQHRIRWISGLVVLLLLGLSVSSAAALDLVYDQDDQPETSPGPITTRNNDQLLPRAAYSSGANEYLVVWEDVIQGNDHDIYAVRVNDQGIPVYSPIPIAVSVQMDSHPAVAYSPATNQYLVAWEYEYLADDHDILAQRIDANGNLVGGLIYLAYTSQYDQEPSVIYNAGTHEFLVVFERNLGSDEFPQLDVMAQRVYEDGTLMGDEITIANGYLDEQSPSAACDGYYYLVAYQGDYYDETNIYGQRLNYNGSLIGGPIGISTWEYDQYAPKVAYDSIFAQYLVVWEDHHFTPWEIYGQRLDYNGNPVGSQVGVALGGTKHRTDPDVAYMPDTRSFLVVWQFEYSASDHDIYSRRIAYDGSHPEPETGISTGGPEEKHPAIVSNGSEHGLIVWEDWRNYSTSGVDVYGSVEMVYVPVLSGAVYVGDPGNYSNPLQGVLVELGCSDDQGYFGDTIAWSVTDFYGQFFLPGYIQCEYYNMVESDPGGYYSVGSQTSGGTVLNSNWIYYTYPLAGKVLTGNYFWDQPEGPGDVTPPGNWSNFQPAGWVNTQTPLVSEQVEDAQSGLDVSTPEYQFTIDGGASWSGWLPASITGYSGTTDPQVISANVPFGHDSGPVSLNQVQFRVADMAGNMGIGPLHSVMIDTVVPSNPTSISSPTHTINQWSNNPYISLQWSGATDDRSGIYGYSTSYDQNPSTIPDASRDTADPSQVIYAYYDSSYWWFHVRTLDNAGNAAAGAVHRGPFLIDTDPPTAWFITQSGQVNTAAVTISWDGGDTLSGVTSYDVQININGVGWQNWRTSTPDESGVYTGVSGWDVLFRARAHDMAGNIGDWSATILISFGVDVTAKVRNEYGSNVYLAKVFRNANYVGVSNPDGTIIIPDVLLGDTISAFYLVKETPAAKSNHGMGGSISWSWRVYQTSINIPNSGVPQLFTVTNTGVVQQITVRRDQALIGVHIIAVVLYEASSAYMEDLRQGLVSASHFLYDVTDGQFFFELIEVYDDEEMGSSNDYIIYSNNDVHPNAFISAITTPTGRMMFPPSYRGDPWADRDLYGVLIHEFGHYGLWLYDEYKIRDGSLGGFCTHNRGTGQAGEPTRGSIMQDTDDASELCSDADPNHLHNSNTEQDASNNGESTWQTVMRVYKDNAGAEDWILRSPDTRQVAVVPGPTTFPATGLIQTYVHDNSTNVCAPFVLTVTDANNQIVIGAEVFVDAASGKIYEQGKTRSAGQITVRGHHNGDTLRVKRGNSSSTSIITCAPGAEELDLAAATSVILEPDAFVLEVSTLPTSNTSLQVRVRASVELLTPPEAVLWQETASQPVIVPLTYDSGLGMYIGEASLDPNLDLTGILRVVAVDGSNNTVTSLASFNLQSLDPSRPTTLWSNDNRMEIRLQPGSLAGNPVVSIQSASGMNLEQASLRVIGSPYSVTTSNGEVDLNHTAVLNIYYSYEQLRETQAEVFGLYRWDEVNETWILISTNFDPQMQFFSAEINQLGTFAILAPPFYFTILPIISR